MILNCELMILNCELMILNCELESYYAWVRAWAALSLGILSSCFECCQAKYNGSIKKRC
jgi:hypothetical protein